MPLVIYAFGGGHTPVPHECNFKNAGYAKVSSPSYRILQIIRGGKVSQILQINL